MLRVGKFVGFAGLFGEDVFPLAICERTEHASGSLKFFAIAGVGVGATVASLDSDVTVFVYVVTHLIAKGETKAVAVIGVFGRAVIVEAQLHGHGRVLRLDVCLSEEQHTVVAVHPQSVRPGYLGTDDVLRHCVANE